MELAVLQAVHGAVEFHEAIVGQLLREFELALEVLTRERGEPDLIVVEPVHLRQVAALVHLDTLFCFALLLQVYYSILDDVPIGRFLIVNKNHVLRQPVQLGDHITVEDEPDRNHIDPEFQGSDLDLLDEQPLEVLAVVAGAHQNLTLLIRVACCLIKVLTLQVLSRLGTRHRLLTHALDALLVLDLTRDLYLRIEGADVRALPENPVRDVELTRAVKTLKRLLVHDQYLKVLSLGHCDRLGLALVRIEGWR